MANLFIFIVTIVGLSGVVAQALILRELLVGFYGNELTIGIVLANWIIMEAIGTLFAGKIIDRIRNIINLFILFQILFVISLPVSVYLARTFKHVIGIPFGEAIGLSTIFVWSLLITLPVSISHGALFSAACKVYSLYAKDSQKSIGKIYSWETIGTIIGGIAFTYIFLPKLNSFQSCFVICAANLLICLFLFRDIHRIARFTIIALLLIISTAVLSGGLGYLQSLSIKGQWPGQNVLSDRNSIYGNVVVTQQEEQYTFFYNGLPIITTPFPDKEFVEDFGHLPLLFHDDPKDVLVISSAAGGLLHEMLKHPLKHVDYVEIDPLIIKMLKDFPTDLTESEFQDPRVHIINTDGRLFLRSTPESYDVILIGLSNQSVLSTNRLFTEEFFLLAKQKLKPRGLLALWLPGSLSYLSRQLMDLNSSILNGLNRNFAFVRIIPGDVNIFLASCDENIKNISSKEISQKIDRLHIENTLLKPAYLDYRLSNYWVDFFLGGLISATKKINQDSRPIAVFESLILWNKKFSSPVNQVLAFLGQINLKWVLFFVSLITAFLIYIRRKSKKGNLAVVYSIATTGFFAMMSNLILIFTFQTFYGYLYHIIGLLISIFMAGVALGSIVMARKLEKATNPLKLLIFLEATIIVFSYTTALMLTGWASVKHFSSAIFFMLIFISGFLAGLEFSLASKLTLTGKEKIGEVSGTLYCADLIGAGLAGFLGGMVFLPVLGLFNTFLVIIILKISSLLVLVTPKKGLTSNTI